MDNSETAESLVISEMPAGCTVVQWADLDGSYEGAGALIYLTPEGKYGTIEYSHCSCDGPVESSHVNPELDDTYELARRRISEYILEHMPLLVNELGEVHA